MADAAWFVAPGLVSPDDSWLFRVDKENAAPLLQALVDPQADLPDRIADVPEARAGAWRLLTFEPVGADAVQTARDQIPDELRRQLPVDLAVIVAHADQPMTATRLSYEETLVVAPDKKLWLARLTYSALQALQRNVVPDSGAVSERTLEDAERRLADLRALWSAWAAAGGMRLTYQAVTEAINGRRASLLDVLERQPESVDAWFFEIRHRMISHLAEPEAALDADNADNVAWTAAVVLETLMMRFAVAGAADIRSETIEHALARTLAVQDHHHSAREFLVCAAHHATDLSDDDRTVDHLSDVFGHLCAAICVGDATRSLIPDA